MTALRKLLHLHTHTFTVNSYGSRRECCTCGCAQRLVNGTWKAGH